MEKNKLLILPFLAGLVLMIYSWYMSYPLSVYSVNDFLFNHVSILYWFSLPLLLSSMCLMAVNLRSNLLKWLLTVGIFLTIFSLSYFYFLLPGSDSHNFRGLTEYFIRTKDLNPSTADYFLWPSFFLLNDAATSVSGLGLANFQFLLYTIMGFLMVTALYVYATKACKNGGFLAVIVFFIAMFYILNYQSAPFSLAFALLLLLFMLEIRKKSSGTMLTMLILFTGISFTHYFVPLFFVLYLLIRCVLNRSRQYGYLFALTLIIYLAVQFTQARFFLIYSIMSIMSLPSEYSSIIAATTAPVSVPLDVIAQVFSRTVTIAIVLVSVAGFAYYLLIRRKMRPIDKAIFVSGTLYSAFGIIFYTLGSRAIPLAFIPVSLGASYLFESKFRRYLMCIFIVLLSLFAFIPLHVSFGNYPIMFQTKEEYTTENFMMEKYNYNLTTTILLDLGPNAYLAAAQGSMVVQMDNVYSSPRFLGDPRIGKYDCIIYNVGFEKGLERAGISVEEASKEIHSEFNVVYDSGSSYVAIKPQLP